MVCNSMNKNMHQPLWSTCADSVLLWAVMEMQGLEAVEQVEVRGGTGGGVFLQVVMQDETVKNEKDGKLRKTGNTIS